MEFGLEKKKTRRYESVFCGSAIHEENTEMIVPDQSPDILRIVKGCADAFLKDKNARDGKIDVSGTVKGAVLYIAEGEKGVRKLDINIPFAYVVDCGEVTSQSKVIANVVLRNLDVREINPRKVSVKASVELFACAYEETDFEICSGVSDLEEYGICTRKKGVSVYHPVIVKEKSFSVNDDIELSSAEQDMCGIITCSASLELADTKVIGNKSILKGNACVNYVYELPDGNLGCGEYELPFSQIIDIEGMEENNDLKIGLSVSAIELEPQYDASGKAHYMTASIAADASIIAFSTEDIDFLEDVYSTKYDLLVERKSKRCRTLHDKIEKRVAVTESIETGSGIKNVLDVSINLNSPQKRKEEGGEVLASDAAISVMYTGEDDGVYCASRRAAVVCPIPLEKERTYEASASVRNKSFSVGAGNEINVRFFTDFDIVETEEITTSAISMISADTDNVKNTEDSPSVIIKRLPKTCDIWDLAKEYSTTVEEIKLANGIEGDICLEEGRMVLVPQKG